MPVTDTYTHDNYIDITEMYIDITETYVAFGFKCVRINTFRVTEVHIVVQYRTTSTDSQ